MLLHERPLEAGLPPGFDTTDEIAAGLRFDEAWEGWLDTALETDSPLAPHLSLTLTLGLSLEQLKQVVQAFHENYADLRDAGFEPGPRPQGDAARTILERWPEAERLCNFSRPGRSGFCCSTTSVGSGERCAGCPRPHPGRSPPSVSCGMFCR